MDPCGNQVGIRNIFISFFDCDNNVRYNGIVHELAGDEQPTYKLCPYTNEALTGGFVRRNRSNQMMNLTVLVNPNIPLRLYQGCASLDVTVEHFNGKVYSGIGGTPTGDERSDSHEVTLEVSFTDIDELLATTNIQAQAA